MNVDDLLLISVGGAAATIVQRMVTSSQLSMRALILDTDDATLQTLEPMPGVSTTIFGTQRLQGRGTGGDYSLGAGAFRDDATTLMAQIGSPRLAVVLTCCGGGTSGAVRTLLGQLRDQGIATMTFATEPFGFEGEDRRRCANVVLPTLESSGDAVSRIPLDALLDDAAREAPLEQAFECVGQRLAAGLGLIWRLLATPGFISFDAEHFHRFLTQGATTALHFHFADATATGEARAEAILQTLIDSPRFKSDGTNRLENASNVLVGVLAGSDLRLSELSTLMDGLRSYCGAKMEPMLGTTCSEAFNGRLTVVLLAFGTPLADVGSKKPPKSLRSGRGTKGTAQLGATRNRFADVEATIYNGQNLDEPTYYRRGIRLAR